MQHGKGRRGSDCRIYRYPGSSCCQSSLCIRAIWKRGIGLQHPFCAYVIWRGIYSFQYDMRNTAEISGSVGLYRNDERCRHYTVNLSRQQKSNGGGSCCSGSVLFPYHMASVRNQSFISVYRAFADVSCAICFAYVGRANEQRRILCGVGNSGSCHFYSD